MKDNGFKLTKESRRYPAQTITDADYANDIVFLANSPTQAETLLHSLERAAAGVGLHVKIAAFNIEQVLEDAPHEAAVVRPFTTHHEHSKLDEPDMWDTAGKVRTNS